MNKERKEFKSEIEKIQKRLRQAKRNATMADVNIFQSMMSKETKDKAPN